MVYPLVRRKLETEPIEDLRIDFEDGFGHRPDAEEDAAAVAAARALARSVHDGNAAPFHGIRFKSFEAPTRRRGLRTLDLFLGELVRAGGLTDGLLLTLPKVTSVDQVQAMVTACQWLEDAHTLPAGRLGFEIQVETPQAILGSGRVGARRADDPRRRRPLHRAPLRHLRLLRVHRGLGRVPEHGARRRGLRQGGHAGRGGRHRRLRLRRLDQRPPGRRRRRGPPRLEPPRPPGPPLARTRLLPGLGPAPGPAAHPVCGDLRLLPRRTAPARRPGCKAYLGQQDSQFLDEPATAVALAGFVLRGSSAARSARPSSPRTSVSNAPASPSSPAVARPDSLVRPSRQQLV